jgi:hypothetical protein
MNTRLSIAVGAALLSFAGCQCGEPCDPEIDDNCPDVDAGQPPPDYCNTPMDAVSDTAHCVLPLSCGPDAGILAFINPNDGGPAIDEDWYSTSFGTLSARALLHVQAGYLAPATPVDLSVTVLQSNASTVIASKIDDHGQGAPKLIDILKPYTVSNSKLLFLVSDKGSRIPVSDIRNPYFISVCTQDDPDVNEPNDSPDGGTQIPLMQVGAILKGTQSGYLATDNDVDVFKFNVPAASPAPRDFIYLHITTMMALMPPPQYRLSYVLEDPNGIRIAEGVTDNAFLQVDLATSKLVRVPGVYTLTISGYRQNPNDMTTVPGDLRQQYNVDVEVMEDLDREEPNDSMAEAAPRAMTLSPGGSVSKTGRLSYVPDPEWFAFDIPASAGNATMSVKLTVAQASGRFAPLAGPHDRQLRIMSTVPGAGVPDAINNCLNNVNGACPKGYDPQDTAQADLVSRICTGFADAGAAECLWLERNANLDAKHFQDLHNMAGVIPVPPRAATTRYWVLVGDDGNNWADDVDWTLTVSLADDPDEARFPASGGLVSSINGTVNGELTYGFGRVLDDWDLGLCASNPNGDNNNSDNCHGIRSPFDYDAMPSDVDTFSFALGFGADEAWGLQWDLFKADGGSLPSEISIDLAFCGMALADGGCSIGTTTAYQSGNFSPWYSDALPDRVVGWTRQDMGSFVRVTANANQCLCFQKAFSQMKMSISVADREYYAPLRYQVTQSVGGYSGTFPGDGGMTTACGQAQADGGGMAACGLP